MQSQSPKPSVVSNLATASGPAPRGLPSELLTIPQVAASLQVCTKTVRRIIENRNIPFVRVGAQIRIRADHVPLFLSKEW